MHVIYKTGLRLKIDRYVTNSTLLSDKLTQALQVLIKHEFHLENRFQLFKPSLYNKSPVIRNAWYSEPIVLNVFKTHDRQKPGNRHFLS